MGFFDKINISDKRMENETYIQYKERIKKNKVSIKMHKKGEQIWNSNVDGTYKKK